MVEDILTEYLQREKYSQTVLKCLLVLLFTSTMRQNAKYIKEDTDSLASCDQALELFDYLSVNYATATLKSTAEHFHYHPNYLSRYIKKHTGKSFKSILNDIRVTQCSYFLFNTSLTITEISEQLGFSQPCNFYDFIDKNYHMKPSELRRQANIVSMPAE